MMILMGLLFLAEIVFDVLAIANGGLGLILWCFLMTAVVGGLWVFSANLQRY